MIVKMKTSMATGAGSFQPGDVVEIKCEETAKRMIASGACVASPKGTVADMVHEVEPPAEGEPDAKAKAPKGKDAKGEGGGK
jgi:hypothetical protein